jgi:hypothetical protein
VVSTLVRPGICRALLWTSTSRRLSHSSARSEGMASQLGLALSTLTASRFRNTTKMHLQRGAQGSPKRRWSKQRCRNCRFMHRAFLGSTAPTTPFVSCAAIAACQISDRS